MGTETPKDVTVKEETNSDVESVIEESDWQESDQESTDDERDLKCDGTITLANANTNANPNQLAKVSDVKPTFGNIAVQHSTDVHFGNKTYYQGPVTIKQFLYGKTSGAADDPGCAAVGSASAGGDNIGFVDDCDLDNKRTQNGGDSVNIIKNGAVINGSSRDLESGRRQCKGVKWLRKTWGLRDGRRTLVLAAATLGVGVTVLALVLVLILKGDAPHYNNLGRQPSEHGNKHVPILTNIENTLLDGENLRLVSRQEWVAQPPAEAPTPLSITPVPYVIISHTATDNCTDQASCASVVKNIQDFHMFSQKWDDIGYNFLVGGDGSVYEGRGWDAQGAHTRFWNKNSLGIAFIGLFNNITPPTRQLKAARLLIAEGVARGKISPDYKLYGARQFSPTLSPGDELFEIIQKWPHFSNKLDDQKPTQKPT